MEIIIIILLIALLVLETIRTLLVIKKRRTDRKNNDISNLRLMTDTDHKSLHAKEDRRGKNGKFK